MATRDLDPDWTPSEPAREGGGQIGVKSVEVGLRVAAALAAAYRPLMLKDLAKALNMPSAKVHRYLVSLIRAGLVEQSGQGGQYGLGPMALRVGLSALHQLDVVRFAGAAIADLRDRTDQTALLAIWGDAGPTIVRWEECRRPMAVNVRLGSVLRLLDSATGLVFAAHLPRHRIADRLAEEMKERSRSEEDLDRRLAEIRARGMARVRGQQMASINALSAPVFDGARNLVGVITLLGSERDFDAEWDSPLAKELSQTARQISERLGAVYVD
ncbi:MAG: IclR family transcriptional regulator [Rhodospirillales bacterium]|nr:IclR family transcriptional regulator [Rhodospirillales bacterium]